MIARRISESLLLAVPSGLLAAIVVGLAGGSSLTMIVAAGVGAAVAVAFRIEGSR